MESLTQTLYPALPDPLDQKQTVHSGKDKTCYIKSTDVNKTANIESSPKKQITSPSVGNSPLPGANTFHVVMHDPTKAFCVLQNLHKPNVSHITTLKPLQMGSI